MSNPTSVVTERRLGAFYQEILPYLGGSADAGFTPVGSVIAIMGVTAPANYLACNGQIVNVSDYPELANYFEQQFGTKYKFGGSGTTFGIPDLRGEFLRGTGTNGHEGQGSGSSVGTHQNATTMPYLKKDGTTIYTGFDAETDIAPSNADGYVKKSNCTKRTQWTVSNSTTETSARSVYVKPTNTSILWCIATKDIYLNPSMDYSTSEKVVGKWIDGKTLYQKTFQTTLLDSANQSIDVSSLHIDNIINYECCNYDASFGGFLPVTANNSANKEGGFVWYKKTTEEVMVYNNSSGYAGRTAIVTIRYTKTT